MPNDGLEERVLEAFRNDPILCERAIDIGGIGEETIELAGWVNNEDEAEHAVVLARGVPGVETVVNRIAVGDLEERIRDHSRRFEEGDDALTEARWEGRTIGTGRRRQGTSDEPDRHATPRVDLEERWTSADQQIEHAADDTAGTASDAPRASEPHKGDRTGGAPIAPTGVPKADHVADPEPGRLTATRAVAAPALRFNPHDPRINFRGSCPFPSRSSPPPRRDCCPRSTIPPPPSRRSTSAGIEAGCFTADAARASDDGRRSRSRTRSSCRRRTSRRSCTSGTGSTTPSRTCWCDGRA